MKLVRAVFSVRQEDEHAEDENQPSTPQPARKSKSRRHKKQQKEKHVAQQPSSPAAADEYDELQEGARRLEAAATEPIHPQQSAEQISALTEQIRALKEQMEAFAKLQAMMAEHNRNLQAQATAAQAQAAAATAAAAAATTAAVPAGDVSSVMVATASEQVEIAGVIPPAPTLDDDVPAAVATNAPPAPSLEELGLADDVVEQQQSQQQQQPSDIPECPDIDWDAVLDVDEGKNNKNDKSKTGGAAAAGMRSDSNIYNIELANMLAGSHSRRSIVPSGVGAGAAASTNVVDASSSSSSSRPAVSMSNSSNSSNKSAVNAAVFDIPGSEAMTFPELIHVRGCADLLKKRCPREIFAFTLKHFP